MQNSTVVFIVGPTSSGKSDVAVGVAEKLNGEIVSCDSMQVYKDMDVITRPPGEDLLSRITHHLVKVMSPEKEFSAARFSETAERIIDSITAGKKYPIITGGTGLYIKTLTDGIFKSPPRDDDYRRKLEKQAMEKGKRYLHGKLMEIDPESACKLHPNDVRRIIRALEVFKLTGRTIDQKKTEAEGIVQKYDCRFFGLSLPRKLLYERIDNVVDEMFAEGLVDEVEHLKERKLSKTAEKALGIKEVAAFLNGEIGLDEVKEELKKNTRRYAKRQLTWFRNDERIEWIDANRPVDVIAEEIAARARETY